MKDKKMVEVDKKLAKTLTDWAEQFEEFWEDFKPKKNDKEGGEGV